MKQKIIDEFTDLPVSRQRKWQLRNPEKDLVIRRKHYKSAKNKLKQRHYYHLLIKKHFDNCELCKEGIL